MTKIDEGFLFDAQAGWFDRRAGLPASAVGQIADAILKLAEHGSGLLLEIGAGTGEIGLGLASGSALYLGLDLSLPMLRQAQARFLAAGLAASFAQADANLGWPVAQGSVRLVFISRAAHLLRKTHLINETIRTCQPQGAWCVLGRIRREQSSIRSTLRHEMRRLLATGGGQGRSGEQSQRQLVEGLADRGGVALPLRQVARWPVEESPDKAIQAWREKPGLAGLPLPPNDKNALLDRLETWAVERYGDLSSKQQTQETYELTAVRLPTTD